MSDKEPVHDYVASRTETFTIGDERFELVAGNVYSGLPEELIETLTGDYGGLEMVPPGTLEVLGDDGEWTVAEGDDG